MTLELMLLKERKRSALKQEVEWANPSTVSGREAYRTTTLGVKGCAVENSY